MAAAAAAQPRRKPGIQRVSTEGRRFVYFDLETTGLEGEIHITQIGACSGHDEPFSTFVLPKVPISLGAQTVSGITCRGQTMYYRDEEVPALTIRPALESFIDFLGRDPVVIIGHYIRLYDCPLLLKALRACDLVERFQRVVHGFVDTHPLFKELQPYVHNFKQATLYEFYMARGYPDDTHNAKHDVLALQQIVDKAKPRRELFDQHSFTLQYIVDVERYKAEKAAWKELASRAVISSSMADKAFKSGLRWEEVRLAFQREGEDAVKEMLRERLTKSRKIIEALCQELRG